MKINVPVILSIAGSDCSGGAGIQADIRTACALKAYCTTAVTAVTAQNFRGVSAVEYVGDRMLEEQLKAVLESVMPDAVKIGMIPDVQAARIIRFYADKYNLRNIVFDPVISASAGGNLSGSREEDAQQIAGLLFPVSTLVTPNIPELYRLSPAVTDNPEVAVREMFKQFAPEAVLLKGGHAEKDYCEDILYISGKSEEKFRSDRIESPHTHGTGCTLSTAIACGLAAGKTLSQAVSAAKTLITHAIENGAKWKIYPEYGPVHPMEFD